MHLKISLVLLRLPWLLHLVLVSRLHIARPFSVRLRYLDQAEQRCDQSALWRIFRSFSDSNQLRLDLHYCLYPQSTDAAMACHCKYIDRYGPVPLDHDYCYSLLRDLVFGVSSYEQLKQLRQYLCRVQHQPHPDSRIYTRCRQVRGLFSAILVHYFRPAVRLKFCNNHCSHCSYRSFPLERTLVSTASCARPRGRYPHEADEALQRGPRLVVWRKVHSHVCDWFWCNSRIPNASHLVGIHHCYSHQLRLGGKNT